MDFTLLGSDPRFLYLKRRLEADGHRIVPDSPWRIAPPAWSQGLAYYADGTYTAENAALTAEGALELLMRRSDRAVAGMEVLVAGFGRIGRALAEKLAALGARVTVAARNEKARAQAAAMGLAAVGFDGLPERADAVVNTVPAPVLRGNFQGALCLDLASAPGGWADDTPVLKAPGLPGLYAPRAAADVMAEAIYRVMEGKDDEG